MSAVGNNTVGYNYQKPITPRLKEVTLSGKGKLYLTNELMDQIHYLHKKVGGIEWCGVLFYKKLSGEINNPDNFALQAEQIYPMNIGSEAYTAAELEGVDTIEMYENCNPNYELKQGLIHTHHNMQAFFSGTDMSELHDNAPLHNYYLSLIVNFSGNYVARIAYVAEVQNKNTVTFNNSEDVEQVVEKETKEKVLVMMDLEIIKPVLQEVVPTYFQERYDVLKAKKEASRPVYNTYSPSSTGGRSYKDYEDWEKDGSAKQGTLFKEEKGIYRTVHPGSQAVQKAKEIQKVQKGPGKLVNEDGKYISVGEFEMRELIIDWLNTGLDVDMEMNPPGKFNSISDALNFFEGFYTTHQESYDQFLTSMQKSALVVFRDYSLGLVSKKGSHLLNGYIDTIPVAVDLYNILDTLQQFNAAIQEYKDDPRKQWEKYQKSY